MEQDEKTMDNEMKKNIPRNPSKKITDDEVNAILKSAAKQVEQKEQKIKGKADKEKNEISEDKPQKESERVLEHKNQSGIEGKQKESQQKASDHKNAENREASQKEIERKESRKKENQKQENPNEKLMNKKIQSQELKKKESEYKKSEPKQSVNQKDIKIEETFEEEPLIINNTPQNNNLYGEKLTVGRVIGTFLESIWTIFKLAVLVTIVTAVAGFLLSRDMMIRGRNGNRKCTEAMTVSTTALSNKSSEDNKVREWLGGVTREKLTLETDDKSILVARRIVIDDNSNKWAVILHGYNGSMADIYDIAMHYTQTGYNVLMPDLRAHGESEGSFLGMGWLDRLDVINWIDSILEENPSAEVVIHGIDIGADTALMLSGEPLKSNIVAVVAEGAYTSAWDVVKMEYKARHEKLPVFPFMNMMNPVMKVWAGYSLKEANAVKQVKNSKVPILLIRGQNDTYVTEAMTNQLDQAIASEHEVFIVQTGTHEDCRYAKPDDYYNKTFEFIGKYVR